MTMFSELKQALEEVRDSRPLGRRALRRSSTSASLSASVNESFALLLNISVGTVPSWEQGTRRPQSTALLLVAMAKANPAVLLVRADLCAPTAPQ